jgi:hypothetical protein
MAKPALAELITRKHSGWYLTDVEYQQLCRAAQDRLNFGHWGKSL